MVSTTIALGVTVGTLAVITGLGLLYSRGRVRSIEDLIAARGTAGEGMTTASLIATGMGAWILFSPAEAGAAFGGVAAIAGYALGSALPLLAFVWVGVRVRELIPAGHSLTEYAYVRYGPAMYSYVLLITVFYMFIFLSAEMTGVTRALALVAGVPEWQTAVLIGGFVLVYTGYGGLVASIFTDTLQTLVILPLLAVGFAAALVTLGGPTEIHGMAVASHPELLDPGFRPGLEFGAYVMIAVLAVNMFNQGVWQRVFAASDDRAIRRSFGVAALAVVPMIFLAGLFGIAAAGLGLIGTPADASVAFFLVLLETFPEWVVLVIVILAILLVMSTADTMFNAIGSIVTSDLSLVTERPTERMLRLTARLVTVAVAIGAVIVGAQGYSVLELFLLADLLAAGTVVPFLAGLYSESIPGYGAFLASVLGLAVGLAYFPIAREILVAVPVIAGLLPPASFLYAFVGAAGLSVGITILVTVPSERRFDLDRLDAEIQRLDRPVADGGSQGAGTVESPEGPR